MTTEIFVVKEIFNVLGQAGVPKSDLHFWSGASALDVRVSNSLLQYLKNATVEEINKFNSLLKEKIEVFKSGSADLLDNLINKEIEFILK